MTREELFEGTSSKRILFGSFFVFGNRLQAAADSFYEEIEITLRTMFKMEQSLIQFKEEGKDEKNSIV